jgi:hypothetical protein
LVKGAKMTTVNKFHWFWAWDDEKEESWLREMSQRGLHLKSYQFPSNYTFEKGNPIDFVYRLDYFTDQKDKENYLQLFKDTGWDHLGEMGGWQYFRKNTIDGEALEIYSDNESKAKKYQRILLFLVIFMPIYMNVLFTSSRNSSVFMEILSLLMAGILLIYIYAMVRLLMRISQLKKKI